MSNLARTESDHVDPVYRGLSVVAGAALRLTTRARWSGLENIPSGGCLLVANHVSDADPLTLGWFCIKGASRYPRYLGKVELWSVPVIGWLARRCGQIPVERATASAKGAVPAAVAAIERGEMVAIYPEGGVSRDPEHWPMKPRTGAARVALETGCPVIPVGQWGAQDLYPPFTRFPRPFPPKRVAVRAGAPLDLSGYAGRPIDHDLLVEVSELMVAAITDIVAELRHETPPSTRHVWVRRGEAPKPVEPRPGYEVAP